MRMGQIDFDTVFTGASSLIAAYLAHLATKRKIDSEFKVSTANEWQELYSEANNRIDKLQAKIEEMELKIEEMQDKHEQEITELREENILLMEENVELKTTNRHLSEEVDKLKGVKYD